MKIKKKSRVPGVMITQYVEELPEGMTTPDFTRKPIALTIQEGKENKNISHHLHNVSWFDCDSLYDNTALHLCVSL